MSIEIKIINQPADDKQVMELIQLLNDSLSNISGSDGSKRAALSNFSQEGALFLLVLNKGKAVACGGFRPLMAHVCEIKRMFSLEKNKGFGRMVLQALETAAFDYGYLSVCLETRKVNEAAVRFYLANGYHVIDNYGIYKGREEAICFEKKLLG
ncbi:GNAT family N-acetyltransferase [Dickeya sp. CFBP 2040]|uniref:GNAT family N-acetyltransferase n=1 Tax=Dickeya sp. CFBP 2040 TaxID=2718531 RepID=UPI0014456FBE|nr:GNAT family N-acetyltransferase [Dickeya sp. CFBP 2040]NKI73631.1 GNAT family N-acetyltransferase [Dickeya sp. CFBP 2040]